MSSKLSRTWPLFVIAAIIIVGASRELLTRYETSSVEVIHKAQSLILNEPGFRRITMSGNAQLRYESFTYQSLDGEINYADDCISCMEEVGDTHIHHSYVSPEQSETGFDRSLHHDLSPEYVMDVIEETTVFDKQGQAIGRRALIVIRSDSGREKARLFWTENGEFWSIDSISERHVRSFERSDTFKNLKPIKN